jgi:hypothetical protein
MQRQLFEVNIDFDEASWAWKENKIRGEYAHYHYKCQAIKHAGNQCSRKADTANIFADGFYCKQHCNNLKKSN